MASNNSSASLRSNSGNLAPEIVYCFVAMYAVILLITVVGNTLVLAAFSKSSKIRRSGTNYFIVSLACADLIVGCLTVPLFIFMIVDTSGYVNKDPSYLVYQFTDVLSVTASIFHLAFISLERYFAVVWPVVHHIATITTYAVVIVLVWILSLAAAGVSLEARNYRDKYLISNSVIVYGVPLAVIVFSYLSILRSTLRRSYGTTRRSHERELKVSVTILILVALFVMLWSPFFVVSALSASGVKRFSRPVTYFVKGLQFAQSCCNPIVYAARIPDFKAAFTKILPKQVISFVFCLVRSPRDEASSISRNRASSALSGTIVTMDGGKESRRRTTLLENKAVVDRLSRKPSSEVTGFSVSPEKCVSFLSESPAVLEENKLTNV